LISGKINHSQRVSSKDSRALLPSPKGFHGLSWAFMGFHGLFNRNAAKPAVHEAVACEMA
jgi:hypothetical protein